MCGSLSLPPPRFRETLWFGPLPFSRPRDLPSFDVSAFPECYTPYAGRSTGSTTVHFRLLLHRPSPLHKRFSPLSKYPGTRLYPGSLFRRCRYSLMLWPSGLLAPLIVPTHFPRAARALSPELAPDSLPLRESGQLSGRSGQLPESDFHLLVDTCYWLRCAILRGASTA